MKIKIDNIDHLGRGISKIAGKVCFIPKSIPGDIVNVSLYKENKNYNILKLDNIDSLSSLRCDYKCPYYLECGGCNIRGLNYQEQLKFKENKVKDIFKKYLNMEIKPNVIGSKKTEGYRNKITYHYDKYLGLVGEYNGIISIDRCLLVSDRVNELYELIKKEDLSKIKKITIRECDNGLILDIDGDMFISNLSNKCISIFMNGKQVYFKEDGYIKLKDLKFKISHDSFFQINTSNITTLYDEIVRVGNFTSNDKVIDLYSGVGSIGIYIAKYIKKVTGIEIIKNAVKDAEYNIKINNINTVSYVCGDVGKINDIDINGDILIVDPPRTGMDKRSTGIINESGIKKIIYVSCDPMTLVRDLKILTNYSISNISVIDMFPETHHTECVCLLMLKN